VGLIALLGLDAETAVFMLLFLDVMKRIAAPMIGGLVASFLLELLVHPAIDKPWKKTEPALPDSPPATP